MYNVKHCNLRNRMKKLFSLMLVSVCILFSCTGCGNSEKEEIRKVLVIHYNTYTEYEKYAEKYVKSNRIKVFDIMIEMLQNLSAIDCSQCPTDFQDAYYNYARELMKQKTIIEKAKKMSGLGYMVKNAIIGGIFGALGRLDLAFTKGISDFVAGQDVNKQSQQQFKNVKEAYYRLLHIAQRYHVTTSDIEFDW